jgi:hypothetical protein
MASSETATTNQEPNTPIPQESQDQPDVTSAGERQLLIPNKTFRAVFETSLIIAGLLAIFFLLPHTIHGDAAVRFQAISLLLEQGKLSNMPYSFVGPAFSIPFWLLGKLYMTPVWWISRFNVFVFAAGLLAIYFLLRNRIDRGLIRKFFLVLIIASMFANHLMNYYGEVFTTMLVVTGIIMFMAGRSLAGWSLVVLGVINIPANLAGLACVVIKHALDNKRWRYILALGAAAALAAFEYILRRGFVGYEAPINPALRTIMPYSGLRGFSYPFFFGLLSILFSFGKGIFFYAPGLLLPVRGLIRSIRARINFDLYTTYLLWISFLVGLVVVYSPWWAWYGGWFWGPRFFLFASIPASLAIALRLHYRSNSLRANILTIAIFCLSLWVGIDGALFGQQGLNVCGANNFALEFLCHYTPEFSALWHPFVANESLTRQQLPYLAYSIIVFVYLMIPLLGETVMQLIQRTRDLGKTSLNFKSWHF